MRRGRIIRRIHNTAPRDTVRAMMPAVGAFQARFGYAPAALFRMTETAHSTLVDACGGTGIAASGGISLYRRQYRHGLYVPAASYGWVTTGLHQPGAASMAVVGGFMVNALAAEAIGLWGVNATDSCRLYARINVTTNKVAIIIADPGGAHFVSPVIDHAIIPGDEYALAYHINRATGFLYARLLNMTTGLTYDLTPQDISAYNALTSGGTSSFCVGAIVGGANGTGVTHLGLAVITAGIAGAAVVNDLTAGCLLGASA